MSDKTKAAMQGRPSSTIKSTIDTTGDCAGGQILSEAQKPARSFSMSTSK